MKRTLLYDKGNTPRKTPAKRSVTKSGHPKLVHVRCMICGAPTIVKQDWGDYPQPPLCEKCQLAKSCVNQLIAEFGEGGWGDFVSHESEGGD